MLVWCVALAIQYHAEPELHSDSAVALGAALGRGVIVALVGMAIARIPQLKRRVWLAQLLPGMLFLIVASVSLLNSTAQFQEAARQDVARAVSIIRQDTAGAPVSASSISDTSSLTFVIVSAARDLRSLFAGYRSAVDTAGHGWLAPKSVVTSRGASRARHAIRQLSDALATVDSGYTATLGRAQSRLVQMEWRDHRWQGVTQGFEQGEQTTGRKIADFIRAERRFLEDASSMLSLVTSARPVVSADSSMLIFSRQADAERYNALLADMREADTAEQTAREALRQVGLGEIRQVDSLRSTMGR